MDTTPWYGVGLDGTLAVYSVWNRNKVGPPIKPMVKLVQELLAGGHRVKIFTARVSSEYPEEEREINRRMIEAWCAQHIGQVLEVTAEKNSFLLEFFDDRAVAVEFNEGHLIVPKSPVNL